VHLVYNLCNTVVRHMMRVRRTMTEMDMSGWLSLIA
jgi:hypothetical protein